ncbi:MAG: nitrile hydratase accessory protein [Cyanobacteria bacterium J06648_10]
MMPPSPNQSTPFMPPDNDSDPVFQAPWEAKAFAIVNQLASTHHYSWSEWTEQLAREISTAELDLTDKRSYYERWLSACEKLLIAKGLLDSQAIDEKIEMLLAERETDHTH